jgi:hypothetical protein
LEVFKLLDEVICEIALRQMRRKKSLFPHEKETFRTILEHVSVRLIGEQ